MTTRLREALDELRASTTDGTTAMLYFPEATALLQHLDRLQEAVLICSEGFQPGWVIGPKQCDYIDELAAEIRELRQP